MGVYRAVKIIYRDTFKDRRPYERELSGIRKYEPISRSHEGFIHVLHVGINESAGYFYYVMEAGDDETRGSNFSADDYTPKTLAKFVSHHGTLPVRECIQLGLALTLALNELHKHALVHRDVKPSNIIFVNGVPKLADLGLVAEIAEARSYVGTEGFIPPEGPGSAQADIYSLGKTLYEVSTGKDRHDFPELPTLVDTLPDLRGFLELNEVILKACKNEPTERYKSAWDMHADLVVLAAGKSVKRLVLLERRLKQLKQAAFGVAGGIAVLAALAYEGYHDWRQRNEQRQRQVGSNIAYGNQAEESGDLLGALPYFVDALKLDSGNRHQADTHRLRIGSILAQCPKLTRVWSDGNQIDCAEFSPDEKRFLAAEFQGSLKIINLQNNQVTVRPFGKTDWLWSASFSPDGKYVATANGDGSACILNATNLAEILRLPHPRDVTSANFSPDGDRLVTSCSDGIVRVWDFANKKIELTLKHRQRVRFAEFSPDSSIIATASDDYAVRIWEAQTGELRLVLRHPEWVYCAMFSPDNKRLVTACADHKARIWDVKSGEELTPTLNHGDAVMSAEFSPDNRLILTSSLDGTARLWNAATLQPLSPNPVFRHGERMMHAGFSPDSRQIITSGADGDIRIWDLAGVTAEPNPQPYEVSEDGSRCFLVTNNEIQVHEMASNQLVGAIPAFQRPEGIVGSRDDHCIAVITRSGNPGRAIVQVWDIATARPVGSKFAIPNALSQVSIAPTGRSALTFGDGVQPWDVATGRPLSGILPESEPVTSAFFSPNGDSFATVSGCNLEVRDVSTGRLCFPPLAFTQPIHSAQFSADGAKIVGCCWDRLLTKCYAQVWSAIDGHTIGPRLMHGDGVLYACFNPDGKSVVTASEDFTAMVWDVANGRRLIPPAQHQEKVRTALFSPDGKWFVTASDDKSARVWSSETGDPLSPPLRHLTALTNAAFLADERHVFTQDQLGECRVWDLDLDHRPIADLIILSRLLSGYSEMRFGNQYPDHTESLEHTWERLDAQYPGTFNVSPEEVQRWYEYQAKQSDVEQNWFAEAFHLRQLMTMDPQNSKFSVQFDTVSRHLAEGR